MRALHGALHRPLQTVGRAERWAALQALLVCDGMVEYVADPAGLVGEGQAWNEKNAKAKGKYATIWRQCFDAQARRDKPPPRFTWAPAHRSLEQVLEQGLPIDRWIGNQWADYLPIKGPSSIEWQRARSSARSPRSTACSLVRGSWAGHWRV